MSGFKLIRPARITDAQLVSSTVVEVAPALYAPGTTYALGATVSVAGAAGVRNVYESLQAGNTGHAPASSPTWWRWLCDVYQPYSSGATYASGDRVQDNLAHLVYQSVADANTGAPLTDATKWQQVGATNRWAFADDVIGTVSRSASPMRVVLKPGPVSGIGFLELQGRTLRVTGKTDTGGTVVYDKTIDLDGTTITSFYDWFFEDFAQLTDLVLTDLPSQFYGLELTLELTSSVGNCSMGVAKPGKLHEIGRTRSGASAGIVSASTKERNPFGGLQIVKRTPSKRGDFSVVTLKSDFSRIHRLLSSIDGELCFFIGTDEPGYEPFLIYGIYRDFSVAVEYVSHHLLAITTEGA